MGQEMYAHAAEQEKEEKAGYPVITKPLTIALPKLTNLDKPARENFELLSDFLEEYWQIWSIDNNRDVEFLFMHFNEAQDALAAGTLDVMAIAVIDSPNSNNLLSIPYAKYRQKVFRQLNSERSNGLQIAIHSSNTSTLNFLSKHIERTYFKDINVMLEDYEQYDALYSTRPWLLKRTLKEKNLLKQFFISINEAPEVYFHFATHRSNRSLMGTINESLRSVSNLQAQLWTQKYIPNTGKMSLTLGRYLTNLSEQEKQFILDNNQLTYPVTNHGLPPYVITKTFSNLTERGFAIDVAEEVTSKTGLIFKPLYVDDKKKSLQSLTSREADVIVIADKHDSIANTLSYSTPYVTHRFNLIHRLDTPSFSNLSDLDNEVIAAVTSHQATRLLQERLNNADLKYYASVGAALLSVSSGETSAFIGSPLVSGYIIKQQQLANLTSNPLIDFPVKGDLSFATLKTNSSLTTLLNRAIRSISPNRLDDISAKWSKTAFTEIDNKEQVASAYRTMGLVVAIMCLVGLIVFWIYYRQLRVRKIAQKRVENALRIAEAAREEAEQSAKAKVTFLARMSHEIRTPMNGVLGMAEALAFTELNKDQQTQLETLKSSARNLLALLNDVLDFSKMDAGKLTLESVPVNIRSLAEGIVGSFKHMHVEGERLLQDINVDFNIDKQITHQYYTDPTRITQVLNNLLSNAFKFTEHGNIELNIELSSSEKVQHEYFDTLHFSVKDSGIGIPPEKQVLLFTPFIQADSDVTRKYGGTGLGLSICQEIVQSMGSEILLESLINVGSNFHFYLQFKRADLENHRKERRKSTRQLANNEETRFKGLRVLVAEDNMVNVVVISAQLERLNIQADVAENGQIALQMHKAQPYDIIISDCHMPELDGFELARILSKNKKGMRPWLIAITADALSGAAQNCYDAGFNDYMAKPCPQEEITNKLFHALRQISTNSDKEHEITPNLKKRLR